MLDALMRAGSITTAREGIGGNVSVEREVVTDAGNRIDILIESDTHSILIENKIFAGVGNPFGDYAAYLERTTSEERAKHKLLLTLSPTEEGGRWGFTNLTYEKFVNQIRAMLGKYVSGADTRYFTLFLDLLNTLENLKKGTRMDEEFIRFLSERNDDAKKFYSELTKFKDELRSKVQELGALVEVDSHQNVRQWFHRERMGLYDDLVHDIRVSERFLASIDTTIGSGGWGIYIWPRRGNRSELRELLQDLEIPIQESQGGTGFHHPARFDYSEILNNVRQALQDLIDKIAMARD